MKKKANQRLGKLLVFVLAGFATSNGGWQRAAAQGTAPDRLGPVDLGRDELAVSLAPGVGERFLRVVNLVMGTLLVRSSGPQTFVIRSGNRGQRDDYADFYASLPYVIGVSPKPILRPTDRIPKGRLHLPSPREQTKRGRGVRPEVSIGGPRAVEPGPRNFVSGEVLVKFKRGVAQDQIDDFNTQNGTKILGRLDVGPEKIFRLEVPDGVDVPDLASEFSEAPLVEYAVPNWRRGIPPMSNGILSMRTEELVGKSVWVKFRPGVSEPVPELLAQVFAVDSPQQAAGRFRYSLPTGVTGLTATRLFKLCPFVMGVEPDYEP